MDCACEFDSAEIHFRGATVIHRLDVLDPLPFKPGPDFIRSDYRRTGTLSDVDNVGHMIAMTMRHEDEIGRDFGNIDFFRERIGCDEGIEEQHFAAGFHCEAGMAVVSEFHGEVDQPQILQTFKEGNLESIHWQTPSSQKHGRDGALRRPRIVIEG